MLRNIMKYWCEVERAAVTTVEDRLQRQAYWHDPLPGQSGRPFSMSLEQKFMFIN